MRNHTHISIHSLHTEGDGADMAAEKQFENISIHSLHTEGDENFRPVDLVENISIPSLHTEGD